MRTADWLARMGNPVYSGLTKRVGGKAIWSGKISLNSRNAIEKPIQNKVPSIYFVNSMSDFFHDNATDEMRLTALEIMMASHWHQFQILTKRPENVLDFTKRVGLNYFPDNVWLGATVEGPKVIDRIKYVQKYPTRIKFLSVEPFIGPIMNVDLSNIDWVITGGESGPVSRPMRYEWLRAIATQLKLKSIPHFFKQWGDYKNNPLRFKEPNESKQESYILKIDPVGKGGSLLDGKYIKEMPEGHKVAKYK